jgi:oxygen-independent coproporphyrinogen-3 oxidase
MSASVHDLRRSLPHAACEFDPDLIRRLDRHGPRYTSYPTADRFADAFGAGDYQAFVERYADTTGKRPLSLYVHVPFCDTVCYYCGCNKVITRNRARASEYLGFLEREAQLQARLSGRFASVEQLHLGGGTPTYLGSEELSQLVRMLRGLFAFSASFEGSIEVDPRGVGAETIAALAELGFNRLSVGVQDFDPEVQRAVNRVQSEEQTAQVIDAARAQGFRSVNVDLIYGLPKQTLASVRETLARVITLGADRIAFYNYAHLPALFKTQRQIAEADLPTPDVKLQMLGQAIRQMTEAGYVHIGMDHFARPGDELAIAQRHGRLQRNFQGYSTHAHCDLLGLGASAIGRMGPVYYQNFRTLEQYYAALGRDQLPVMRGLRMSRDDLIRQSVIQALICQFEVCKENVESTWMLDFGHYFEAELKALEAFAAEGLVELDSDWISVPSRGRLLIRSICMEFDRYLREDRAQRRYSKVI